MGKGILMQCKLIQSKIQNAALGIISKLNVSPLVSLCKERKNFIKAAKYCRYDLVSTHDKYLQSLLDVGYALNQYVEEELLVFGDPSQVSGSDFETSEEDSHFEFPSFDSESDLDSTPFDTESEDQSAANMDYINDKKNGIHGHLEHKHRSSYNRLETPQRMHEFPDQHMNWDSSISYNIDDRNEAVPMDIPFEDQKFGKHASNASATPPPTPPPPQVTSWDFLSLFSSMENDNYFDNMKYVCNASSNNSDLDLRQVREREGIPDLEDETEQIHPDLEYETAQSSTNTSIFNEMEVERGLRHSNKETSSDEDAELKDDINYEAFVPKKLAREGLSSGARDEQISLLGTESLGTSSLSTPPVASCRRDFREAVQEIREEFQSIFNFGKEILEILEVGKRPHHCTKLKAFASRVLRLMAPSIVTYSRPLSKSTSQARLSPNAERRNDQEHVFPTSADLSSTLDKLCAWEKKLYVQVNDEEKLRILYDNQYKRLKMLDDGGSESEKINDAMASTKDLHSKITVVIASITLISREIHKLRDHTLLPELQRLIEGLIRLWKFMAKCHQKQLQVIMMAKSHVHISHPHMRKKSSSRATLRLEKTILNWSVCFSNLVNTQKAFVKYLNEWLQRCILILHQPEEADQDEGIASFSPSRIGAPLIFTLCNDWYQAIDKISESGVCRAIDNFASSLHQLYEMLEQEQVERRKTEKLLKENGISWHKDSSFTVMADLEPELPKLGAYDEGLATSRQRLIEQKEWCNEVVKRVNDAVSSCLEEGLSPIFEALGRFCLENLQAYEKLLLPKARARD